MDNIVSAVVGELVQVAKAAEGTNITTLEFNNKLMDKARSVLKSLKPQLKELSSQRGDSAERVAKDLAHKINQSKVLRKALFRDQKITPRFPFIPIGFGIVSIALQVIIETTRNSS